MTLQKYCKKANDDTEKADTFDKGADDDSGGAESAGDFGLTGGGLHCGLGQFAYTDGGTDGYDSCTYCTCGLAEYCCLKKCS